jgi:hypothetical protein
LSLSICSLLWVPGRVDHQLLRHGKSLAAS